MSGPRAPADIDVLVIGRVDRDDLFAAAQRAERRVGREVNVTQRTAKQWTSATDGFTTQLRSSPMIAIPSPPGRAEMEQAK